MNNEQVREVLPSTQLEPDMSIVRRSVRGAMIGNAIEWFDYSIYAYLSFYMAQLFFSNEMLGTASDSPLPLILSLSTLALSFVVRPLGGLILGPLGDRIGRQRVLVWTVVGISGGTALIGLLPTAAQVGFVAPILLVLVRMIQGFSAGGEYSAASSFLCEHAPDRRRGFYVSFLEVGTWGGTAAAALLCTVVSQLAGHQGMVDGWWRLPFLVAVPLGLVGLMLRRRLTESTTFLESMERRQKAPTVEAPTIITVFKLYPKQLLKLAGFTIMLNVSIYMVIGYLPAYIAQNGGVNELSLTYSLVAVQFLVAAVVVPFGAWSDRVGRRPLLIGAGVWFIIFSVPAFLLVQSDSPILQFIGMAGLGLPMAVCAALTSCTLPGLFPTSVRNSGFAISYNTSTAIFGGTAPAVTVWLVSATGNDLVPGWYLVLIGVIGLLSVLTFAETAGASLRGEDLPGRSQAPSELVHQRI